MSPLGAMACGAFLVLACAFGCAPCMTEISEAPRETTSKHEEHEKTLEVDQGWMDGHLPASILDGNPKKGGKVTIRAYYEPDSLNPLLSGAGMTRWIVLHNVVETLLRRDPYAEGPGRFLPSLAKSWEMDESQTTYTFRLRKDALWHDGKPFTSRDVAKTFEKIADPRVSAGSLGPLYRHLETVETPDEHTVRFKWKHPYFLALDTIASTPVQPAHILEHLDGRSYNEAAANPLNRAPLGTGPFKFLRWDAGSRIVLERNEDWWGNGPWLDQVIYRIVPDHSVARQLAQQRELDVWDAVQPHMWIRMNEEPRLGRYYHRVRYDDAAYVFIGWNSRRPQLSDPSVRRALSMLFDRDALIDGIQHGLVRPATCHFYFASNDCDSSITPLPHDPAQALAKLSEAGWKDTTGDGFLDREDVRLQIDVMIYPASEVSERVSTTMLEEFKRAGIDVRIQEIDWPALVRRLRTGEFDATVLMWNTGPISDPVPYWHSGARLDGANYFGFKSTRADTLMEEARRKLDDESRQELFRELGALLYEKQPVTFLYHPSRLALVSKRLRGVRPSLEWWQPRDWWIEDASR